MNKKNKGGNEYILNEYIPQNVKEAYKGIRTNIECTLVKEGCRKIMVSGPDMGVGSTVTCINLAVNFAQSGAKVLVIDGDLRNPQIHVLLYGKTLLGLTEFLTGKNELNEVMQISHYEGLDFIAAGGKVSNPSELLDSAKMKVSMQELERCYDYIFINTPPINIVTDGRILASQMDGVVAVVKQGETTHKDLENMLWHLRKVNAPVLGTVLNHCRVSRSEKHKYKAYSKVNRFR